MNSTPAALLAVIAIASAGVGGAAGYHWAKRRTGEVTVRITGVSGLTHGGPYGICAEDVDDPTHRECGPIAGGNTRPTYNRGDEVRLIRLHHGARAIYLVP